MFGPLVLRKVNLPQMDPSAFTVFGAAAVATAAAIVAVIADRFRSVSAGIITTTAGILPWLFWALWF